MTPPEEHALELSVRALGASDDGRLSPKRLYLSLPVLSDLAALLTLAVLVRLIVGRVDLLTGSFILGLALIRAGTIEGSERLHLAALDEVGATFRAVLLSFAGVTLVTAVLPAIGDVRESAALLALVVWSAPTLILARSFHYAAARQAARSGRRARTLVIGAGAVSQEIISVLDADGSYGLEIVGALDDDARFRGPELGTRILGGLTSLGEVIASHKIGSVIVAFSGSPDESTMREIRSALEMDVDVWVVPRFFEMGAPLTGFDHIGSVPVVRIHARASSRRGWRTKRALDIVTSLFGIVISAPLLAAVAVAIKLDSKGPVFFRQERIGLGGRAFSILKFRTMSAEAAPATPEWTARSDRITRVGRVLRDSGLDELPQLFNVLRGDLTLVGPRPERPEYVDLFDAMYPHYSARHRVPAGITGWAQIHGLRGDTSIDERARFDNYYIENWSLGRDLKIMLLTWRTWLKRYKGATEASDESMQVRDQQSDVRTEVGSRTP